MRSTERMNLRGGSLSRLSCSGLSHRIFYKTETLSTAATRFGIRSTTRTTPKFSTHLLAYRSMVNMAGEHSKWTAAVVRKTFLEYFEGKAHTIGTWRGSFCRHFENLFWALRGVWELNGSLRMLWIVSIWVFMGLWLILELYSPFILCGTPQWSYSSLHQCWYEPIQAYFLGNSRQDGWYGTIETCGGHSESMVQEILQIGSRRANFEIVYSCRRKA